MIYMWRIFVDGEPKCTVGAMTEQSAIDKYWNWYGSASAYTGLSRNSVEAIRV